MAIHRIGVLTSHHGSSEYLCEILQTWGIANYFVLPVETLEEHSPNEVSVLVCGKLSSDETACILKFVKRGGSLISCAPNELLLNVLNVEDRGQRLESVLRLVVAALPSFALGGQSLPIVGDVRDYRPTTSHNPLAYISEPLRHDGVAGESAGIVDQSVGKGRIIQFAFDLQKSVLLHRQGDPAKAVNDTIDRPSNLAVNIGQQDAGWIPYADLLARLLVDAIHHISPHPLPWLYHLPLGADALVLYSGDEDNAALEANQQELDTVAAAGGRMNLYIIPDITHSDRSDVQRYQRSHDVGVHPDITPLRNREITPADAIADFERQINLFEEMYGFGPRTTRHHSTGWIGYLDLVESQKRAGIEMDANFFSGHVFRDREHAPYSPFGGAMPMRFCYLDGKTINVFQQHTQINDDVLLAPDRPYSYHFTTEVFSQFFQRMLVDSKSRFHVPLTVNFHPGNWGPFSRGAGEAVLRLAKMNEVPIWSLDQWLDFWKCRDAWRITYLEWTEEEMQLTAEGGPATNAMCLAVPMITPSGTLASVESEKLSLEWKETIRFGERVALVFIPEGLTELKLQARYQESDK